MVSNFKLQLFTRVCLIYLIPLVIEIVDYIYFIISSQIYIMNTKSQTDLGQLVIEKYERLKKQQQQQQQQKQKQH